jgi:Tol biopolymer transport system component
LYWSDDGQQLHFLLANSTNVASKPWQITMDASFRVLSVTPSPLQPDRCCELSLITPQYEFFVTKSAGDQIAMWTVPRHPHWWLPARLQAVDLTAPLASLSGLAADPRGGRLFAAVNEPLRWELLRFDPHSRVSPFLPGISAVDPDISRDGKKLAFVDSERTNLCISETDGTGKHVLASFAEVELPRWSPDGGAVAFMARKSGGPWRIYVTASEGGLPREVSAGDENQGAPTWSPDGRWLAYADVLCVSRDDCAVHRVELSTGKIETLPGSHGLRTARWSPDGHYIAALQVERHQLSVFNLSLRRWSKLADQATGDDLDWSHDSRYIYFNRPTGDAPGIFRIPVRGGNAEMVVDLKPFIQQTGSYETGLYVTPDDSVILLRQVGSADIYALDWAVR